MSYLQEAGTPCPGPRPSRFNLRNEGRSGSFRDLWDDIDPCDDTAAIEFTTEIRAPLLTGAKPRRARRTAAFKIHEDSKEQLGSTAAEGPRDDVVKRKPLDRKSTMLSQPAQRFKPKVSFAVSPSDGASKTRTEPDAKPAKVDTGRNEKNSSVMQESKDKGASPKKDELKKDVRRNTIYIPDDTTVPSVFMGIFSPIKSQTAVSEDTQIDTLEARIAKKQQERKSLSAAPRRAPLQQSTKVAQETTVKRDIAGKNGGKENIPPGALLVGCKDKDCKAEPPVFELPVKSKPKAVETIRPSKVTKSESISVRSSLHAGKKNFAVKAVSRTSPKRAVLGVKHNAANSATLCSSLRRSNTAITRPVTNKVSKKVSSRITKSSTSSALSSLSRRNIAPSKLTIPNIPQVNIDKMYPLLTEDISNPIMYEDNWLTHQEIAITQLVNSLFDSADGNPDFCDPDTLRHDLLEIYQDESFVLLYKRLQASLLYGALSVPKDILARGNRLKEDLGLKRTFLDFWTQTYDFSALRAAAETVIGRRISVSSRLSGSANDTSPNQTAQQQEKILKKTLEAFLETFLLRNEDKDQGVAALKAGETNEAGWAYRRTLLRSILIIVLLDKGRLSPDTLLPRRLFVPSSRYKSSAAALQALGHILLPSVGDINRPLSHLDCHVSYKQHPLQEYEYRIKNLAVDLRDGVRLTRLVELLLYPSASHLLSRQYDPDASTTVTMPTGEALNLLDGENDWPLSQHLKFPCVGRATKLFNVQVALSALLGVKGVGVIAQDIRAEDIVDGYREKTIALLWGLVGKWGLGGLVDWDDVRKEIIRLKRKLVSQFGKENSEEDSENEVDFDEGYERHAFLLKQWASLLARLKGLRLDNLTTSFADGKIFGSIVDEYEGYIIGSSSSVGRGESTAGNENPSNVSLDSRLRALGCSAQFGKSYSNLLSLVPSSQRDLLFEIVTTVDSVRIASLVSPGNSASSRIFDRDFTLASLAFLCSRLLSASKRTRAALVLQSAWRRVLARRTLHLRILAKQVASQCAAVVRTRDRILWAKEVIVRWWRRQKERRKRRIERARNGPAKTQSIKKTATSKPATVKSTTMRVGARRQPLGNSCGNVLEKQKRAPKGVMFEEKVNRIDNDGHDDAENDIWLSL